MSLTPIAQYASTASISLRASNNASASRSLRSSVRSLASGQIVQANGLSEGLNAAAKSSINVAYDRLARQTYTGAGVNANANSSLRSFLASYVQNSSSGASAQSSGSLFRASA